MAALAGAAMTEVHRKKLNKRGSKRLEALVSASLVYFQSYRWDDQYPFLLWVSAAQHPLQE